MLQEALENEVAEYLARMSSVRTQDGRQAIVRNGFLPARELVTGVGPVRIRQGRVRDRWIHCNTASSSKRRGKIDF